MDFLFEFQSYFSLTIYLIFFILFEFYFSLQRKESLLSRTIQEMI